MATNKFPGRCGCGSAVPAGAGSCAKRGSRWVITCVDCAIPSPPVRDFVDFIYWPNGLGCRECTAEYRDAYDARERAQSQMIDGDLNYSQAYEAFHRADHLCLQLQADGHLGAVVRYEHRDPQQVALVAAGIL